MHVSGIRGKRGDLAIEVIDLQMPFNDANKLEQVNFT